MGKPGLRECVLHHPLDLLLVFLLCSRDQGSFLRELAGIPYQGQFLLAQRLRGWELIKLGLSRSHDCGKRAVRDSSGPVRCRRPNSVALAVGHNLRCWFAGSLSRGRRVTRCQRVRRLARSPSQGQRHDEHRRHRGDHTPLPPRSIRNPRSLGSQVRQDPFFESLPRFDRRVFCQRGIEQAAEFVLFRVIEMFVLFCHGSRL